MQCDDIIRLYMWKAAQTHLAEQELMAAKTQYGARKPGSSSDRKHAQNVLKTAASVRAAKRRTDKRQATSAKTTAKTTAKAKSTDVTAELTTTSSCNSTVDPTPSTGKATRKPVLNRGDGIPPMGKRQCKLRQEKEASFRKKAIAEAKQHAREVLAAQSVVIDVLPQSNDIVKRWH